MYTTTSHLKVKLTYISPHTEQSIFSRKTILSICYHFYFFTLLTTAYRDICENKNERKKIAQGNCYLLTVIFCIQIIKKTFTNKSSIV